MNVYIYNAALHCEDCGDKIKEDLDAKGEKPDDPDDEHSYDSDDYPKGPYNEGGGEADCPHHCDSCGVFLENPLTSDGAKYVEEAVREAIKRNKTEGVALTTWASFYDIHPELTDD